GSTCNACLEPNPLAATLATITLPESGDAAPQPTPFAKGLRNTIGFAWHPTTGELWGMDHGIDWLGDDEQGEELNRIAPGADYGWPVVYERNRINDTLASELPRGESKESYAARCTPSTMTTTAHAAPMQMAFCTALGALGDYVGDAFVAMHGSWNRKDPSGYSVVRVRFDPSGEPKAIEPFLTGWLDPRGAKDGSPTMFGRPCGLAFAKDGAMLITDDLNGVVYRVARK
ncbi:MAG TPA: PQQ-dependent sugar dehydrogenase, partial [Phycisphaerales bacterium]|nr:PQQ-dependent sugar dehydrogenase [Phycisphaerales bacterium]